MPDCVDWLLQYSGSQMACFLILLHAVNTVIFQLPCIYIQEPTGVWLKHDWTLFQQLRLHLRSCSGADFAERWRQKSRISYLWNVNLSYFNSPWFSVTIVCVYPFIKHVQFSAFKHAHVITAIFTFLVTLALKSTPNSRKNPKTINHSRILNQSHLLHKAASSSPTESYLSLTEIIHVHRHWHLL